MGAVACAVVNEVEEVCCSQDCRLSASPEVYDASMLARMSDAPLPGLTRASFGSLPYGAALLSGVGSGKYVGKDSSVSKLPLEADFPATALHWGGGWSAEEIEWEVELVRTEASHDLGVGLFVTPHALLVQSVAPGMLQAWNEANPDREVRRGSVIVEVNGSSADPKAILHALRYSKVLNIKLKRVSWLKVLIEKGSKLGMDVNCKTMTVQQVKETGSIDMHNRSCQPGYQMIPGDVIVGVNEISEDTDKMLDEIYLHDTLLFHISRD